MAYSIDCLLNLIKSVLWVVFWMLLGNYKRHTQNAAWCTDHSLCEKKLKRVCIRITLISPEEKYSLKCVIILHTNNIKRQNDWMVEDKDNKHESSKREAHISKWIGILLSILIFACNSAYHLMLIYRICYQLLSKGICLNTDIKIRLRLYVCSLEC